MNFLTWCSLCVWAGFSCRALGLVACSQRVGVLQSLVPASLLEHQSMGQAHSPPMYKTAPCAWSVLSCHVVCHRQQDWAVSISPHMQQHMDMCLSSPRQRAILLADTVHHKNGDQQNGDSFLQRTKKSCVAFSACLTPRRATSDLNLRLRPAFLPTGLVSATDYGNNDWRHGLFFLTVLDDWFLCDDTSALC